MDLRKTYILLPVVPSPLLTALRFHSRFWEECPQVCHFSNTLKVIIIHCSAAHRSSGIFNASPVLEQLIWHISFSISSTLKSKMSAPYSLLVIQLSHQSHPFYD